MSEPLQTKRAKQVKEHVTNNGSQGPTSSPALAKLYNYLLHWAANHKDEMKQNMPKLEEKLKGKPQMLEQIQRIINGDEKPPAPPAQSTLNQDILRMYESGKDCDFTLVCEGEDIHCHKCILACRCDYFAGVFRSGMTEVQAGKMVVPGPNDHGLTRSSLKGLLKYFYSNEVKHLEAPMDCLFILSSAGYFSLSNEFGNRHTMLLDHCEEIIVDKLTPGNCIELWNTAYFLRNEDILDKIENFMVSKYSELSKREDFKQLPKETLDNVKTQAKSKD
mmetsp:Transcript_1312/g.1485  ORF Transcript_1312/g.1485 Transcript_1312/m.1485 type:complete len:276 (-) Transcript_1312:48-875(-)|eukprot:CAMPEP_0168519034 /NCGR_PEP_ID=MMETSP0405-20121227/7075_1 /TAXON_ID=498012 /ORGANISM="Trichosphaerium sp, Strain Am-I-7 wt" /LENGTH=275 /DNA_ID=CAMNT_0008539495 /DNA_START=24 /DNA_END=851 /DNA_ORIENTATION=+